MLFLELVSIYAYIQVFYNIRYNIQLCLNNNYKPFHNNFTYLTEGAGEETSGEETSEEETSEEETSGEETSAEEASGEDKSDSDKD